MQKELLERFDKLLEIDRYNLDKEILEQPRLLWEVVKLATQATKERHEAKKALERLEAKLCQAVRMKAIEQGTKITEAFIKERVELDTEYQAAHTTFLEAQYEQELLEGLKESFAQRQYNLRSYTELYKSNYGATGA